MPTRSPLPQAIDRELADIAAAVYSNEVQQVGNWMRVYDAAPSIIPAGIGPTSRPDPTSGFRAAVFRNDEGKHALAFCGSEREARDWFTNLGQGLGLDTSQYRQAAAFAQECKVQFGDQLVITGHSLGGGLATIAAAVSNTPAVTFNPAGVHRNTLARAGIDTAAFSQAAEAGLIRQYVVKGEILDRVNKLPLLPSAYGARIELEDPAKAWIVSKHGMTAVERSMDAANLSSVAVPEHALPSDLSQNAAMATAFRSQRPREALARFPGLANAYAVMSAAQSLITGVSTTTRTQLTEALREGLAKRIERGEAIPAPRVTVQRTGEPAIARGPER